MLSMSVDSVMTKVCNLATFNAPFQIENTVPENVHAGAGCLLELWDEFAKGLFDGVGGQQLDFRSVRTTHEGKSRDRGAQRVLEHG